MSEIRPAFSGEMQLLSWSETNSGGAKIVLALASPKELEAFKLMTVKKGNIAGQRLAVVIVEIGEDEMPVEQVSLTKSAALLCNSPSFWRFVEKRQGYTLGTDIERIEGAAQYLRAYCQIASRAELATNGVAGARYHALLSDYKQNSHAGTL
jgi:hypothetical protein